MTLIERCIRLPVTVTVAVMLILLFGLVALFSGYVPVQLTPTVDQPVITITTRWFGASPQEVVREIVDEQEDVLKTTTGLREMTSSAREGEAVVRLELAVGIDKEEAMDEVRDKLRLVPDYPDDVDEPLVEPTDFESRDYIGWFVIRRVPGFTPAGPVAAGFEHGDITRLGTFFRERVKPVLERADGISEIQILGGREREVQVRVDLQKLASMGVSVSQLADALRRDNLDVTAGTIDEGKRSTSVRVLGQFTSLEQVMGTVFAETAAGQPVAVRDVAYVVSDFKKETTFVHNRGEAVVAMNGQRDFGSNVIQVMTNLRRQIDIVNREVLGPTNWGIEIQQVYDQTFYIHRAVDNARNDLILGAVLASAVLLFTLRSVGATLVVVVAIPISVVGTFLGMALLGRSLNVISVAGLTFAVGMAIDNVIVVLENIFRHREMGKDNIRAAIDGTKEVWGAILSASLANLAVFLPIIFIQEEAGQLFRDLAIALAISFFFYLFVSPTVIPMLATLMLRKIPAGLREDHTRDTAAARLTGPVQRIQDSVSRGFYNLVYWLTGGAFKRGLVAIVMVGVSAIISWLIIPPRDYLPPGNQNFAFGILAPPPGYNVDEFRRMGAGVEAPIRPWWETHNVDTKTTDAAALDVLRTQRKTMLDQFVIPGMEAQITQTQDQMKAQGLPEQAIAEAVAFPQMILDSMKFSPPPPAVEHFFFVVFGNNLFMGGSSVDPDNVGGMIQLFNGAVQGIPGTFGFFMQVPIFATIQGGGIVELAIYGEDDAEVRRTASAVMFELGNKFGFDKVQPAPDAINFDMGREEVQIVPDREHAASAQVGGAIAIRDAAQVAVDGLILGDYRDRGDRIDLTLVSNDPRADHSREKLADVPLAGVDGRVVTLDSVARFVNTTAASTITHTEEQPSVRLNVQIPPGLTISQAVDTIEDELLPPLRTDGRIPATVNTRLEGSARKLDQFMRAFIPGFILAAAITYLLLAALFESFLHPLTIIASVPFAMVGGFAGIAVLHAFVPEQKMDVLTMLGFVILVGTIINNPILIVHQALNYMNEGTAPREAIARSTQTRVRPIFMSVITSVAGMLPLVLFGGAGSELYRGLGAVIVGGLLVSTVFTLILTPTLMSLLIDLQTAVQRLFRR
jgi:hydrophobic/amphiphilic exporter-1 (mainly G- bacteria), HAE1 family